MKNNSNSNVVLFAAGLVAGIISCLAITSLFKTNTRFIEPNAFYLGVKIIFPNEDDKMTFETEFGQLALYIRRYEPNTISYELLQSDKDPLQVYILERYKTKIDYLEVHKKSEPFLAFREKFQKMIENGAKVEGDSYIESGIGFL